MINMYIETIMINHNHYWFQSSLSVILYHQCSTINLVIIVIIISITSHQHSIIIIDHGNFQQSSIIGLKEGCRFPILLVMQCLDTNVTFSHIVSVKHLLVSKKYQQC